MSVVRCPRDPQPSTLKLVATVADGACALPGMAFPRAPPAALRCDRLPVLFQVLLLGIDLHADPPDERVAPGDVRVLTHGHGFEFARRPGRPVPSRP